MQNLFLAVTLAALLQITVKADDCDDTVEKYQKIKKTWTTCMEKKLESKAKKISCAKETRLLTHGKEQMDIACKPSFKS